MPMDLEYRKAQLKAKDRVSRETSMRRDLKIRGANLAEDNRPQESALIKILAGMVRSALAWEAEHESLPEDAQSGPLNRLSGTPLCIHSALPGSHPPPKLIRGGKDDDQHDPDQERTPGDDLRGPEGPAG